MNNQKYKYDVFVSYNDTDEKWIDTWLLPALTKENISYILSSELLPGEAKIRNSENAIRDSCRTIAVITPEWKDNEWKEFETLALRSIDPNAQKRKLIPVILKETNLQDFFGISVITPIDFTDCNKWKRRLKILVKAVNNVIYVPIPSIRKQTWSLHNWIRWLRRYRKNIFILFTVLLLLWALISIFFKLSPFEDRQGWKKITSMRIPDASQIINMGKYLLVSTRTDRLGIDTTEDTGLWKGEKNKDGEYGWHKITINELIFKDKSSGYMLGDIKSFFSVSENIIYAAARKIGLLISYDSGETWAQYGKRSLPTEVNHVGVIDENRGFIFVNSSKYGIFRSDLKLKTWINISEAKLCENPMNNLPKGYKASSMEIAGDRVFVGNTKDKYELYPNPKVGMYVSDDYGKCWSQVIPSNGRYGIKKIKKFSGNDVNKLIIVAYDYQVPKNGKNWNVWVFDINTKKISSEWVGDEAIYGVYGKGKEWFISGIYGHNIKGEIGSIEKDNFPLPQCQANNLFYSFFTSNKYCLSVLEEYDKNSVLLLANENIYALKKISWYESIWP